MCVCVGGGGGVAKRFCFPAEAWSKIEVLVNNPLDEQLWLREVFWA